MTDDDLRSTRIKLEIRAQEISDQLDTCAQRLNDLIVMLQAVYPQVATLLENPANAGSQVGNAPTTGSTGS